MSEHNNDETKEVIPATAMESNESPPTPIEEKKSTNEQELTTDKQEALVTPQVENSSVASLSETPQDIVVPKKPDEIESYQHDSGSSDALVPSLSTELNSASVNETKASELEDQTKNIVETADSEHIGTSVNDVVPNVMVSLASECKDVTDGMETKVDSTEELITEPTMHVVNPCTEVPEPVGTPKASRSKITESAASDSTTELNVAKLVDAVVVREGVLEEIEDEQQKQQEEEQHEDKENAEPVGGLKSECEPDGRPKRPPPPMITSTAHGQAAKKHHGLHFRFGGSNSKEGSLERRTFGSSMRNAIGTLTRSIKKKQQQMPHHHHHPAEEEPKVKTIEIRSTHSTPFRPSEQYHVAVKSPNVGEHDYHEEQSLQSVSGVSLSYEPSPVGTPNQKRRNLLRSTAPDFVNAFPPEENMSEAQPIYVNHSMQPQYQSNEMNEHVSEIDNPDVVNMEAATAKDRVLSWTAASIARTGMHGTCNNYDNPVEEGQIHPVHVTRGQPQQKFLYRLVTHDLGTQSSRGGTSGSPKPPRPISRPVLSPLDYQAFHSEDSISHPEVVTRRVEVTVAQSAPHSVNEKQSFELHENPAGRNVLKTTASLDRREYDPENRTAQGNIRRVQTLRTPDYAGRLRERLRTIRGGSCEIIDESGGTLRVTKPRSKPENYVCSETIRLPTKLFKLKRRQTTPAKTVHSTPSETVIPRPQPRLAMSYHPAPITASETHTPMHEDVLISQTVMVHGKPPPAVSVQRPQSSFVQREPLETPRRLTSLKTLAASVEAKQCTTLPDSPQRGLIRMADAVDSSQKLERDITVFPYLSDELTSQLAQTEQGLHFDANNELVATALSKIHPVLSAWSIQKTETSSSADTEQTADEQNEKTKSKPQLKSTIQDYLNACVRLRSVDLQGHFASFHYPLGTFNDSSWHTCAHLVPWDNLAVIREPETNTEYVQLPFSKQDSANIIYPNRPIETLLTNWLDCHQTATQSGYTVDQSKSSGNEDIKSVYHPILMAATLDQLLSKTEETKLNEFADTGFRLATLLSYEDISKRLTGLSNSEDINTNLNDILVLLSTGNCLIVFRKQSFADNPDDESAETGKETLSKETTNNQLVKSICPEHETIAEAIDALIEKWNAITASVVHGTEWSPAILLKAIAPPDWLATCSSRIYLKQQ